MKITIERWEREQAARAFRAMVYVPQDWGKARFPGVLGYGTAGGSWCEGFGATPGTALADLERKIGRTFIRALALGITTL